MCQTMTTTNLTRSISGGGHRRGHSGDFSISKGLSAALGEEEDLPRQRKGLAFWYHAWCSGRLFRIALLCGLIIVACLAYGHGFGASQVQAISVVASEHIVQSSPPWPARPSGEAHRNINNGPSSAQSVWTPSQKQHQGSQNGGARVPPPNPRLPRRRNSSTIRCAWCAWSMFSYVFVHTKQSRNHGHSPAGLKCTVCALLVRTVSTVRPTRPTLFIPNLSVCGVAATRNT